MIHRPLNRVFVAVTVAALAVGPAWSAEDAATLTKEAKDAKAAAVADTEKAQAEMKDAAALETKAREDFRLAEEKERAAEIASGMTKDQILAEDLRRKGESLEKESHGQLIEATQKRAQAAAQEKEINDMKAAIADAKGKNASADHVKLLEDVMGDDDKELKVLNDEVDSLEASAKGKEANAKKLADEAKSLAAKAGTATGAATK